MELYVPFLCLKNDKQEVYHFKIMCTPIGQAEIIWKIKCGIQNYICVVVYEPTPGVCVEM
jgi:hypothetical protein